MAFRHAEVQNGASGKAFRHAGYLTAAGTLLGIGCPLLVLVCFVFLILMWGFLGRLVVRFI